MAIYNFQDTRRGDTVDAVQVELLINSTPEPITGWGLKGRFRKGDPKGASVKEIDIGSGITVTDGPNGIFVIDDFQQEWAPDTYYYDIQFTDLTGRVKTWLTGTLTILADITYE